MTDSLSRTVSTMNTDPIPETPPSSPIKTPDAPKKARTSPSLTPLALDNWADQVDDWDTSSPVNVPTSPTSPPPPDNRDWCVSLVTKVVPSKGKGGGVVYCNVVKNGIQGSVIFPAKCFSNGDFVNVSDLGLSNGDLILGDITFYDTPVVRGKFTTLGICNTCSPSQDFLVLGGKWQGDAKIRHYGLEHSEDKYAQVTISYGKKTHAFGTNAKLVQDGKVLSDIDGDVFLPVSNLYKGDIVTCDIIDWDLTKTQGDKTTGTRFRSINVLNVQKAPRKPRNNSPPSKTPKKSNVYSSH